jgi:hypothetical protein
MDEIRKRVWFRVTYAEELIGDARILESPRGPADFMSDFPKGSLSGFNLLYAFALEVLLKATILLKNDEIAGGHANAKMWEKLPQNSKTEIIKHAEEYSSQHNLTLHCGLSDPGKLFSDWGHVFTNMRYRYEILDDKSEKKEEQRRLRERKMELGANDPELADWRTWDRERDCMIEAFLKYIYSSQHLNMAYRNERVR